MLLSCMASGQLGMGPKGSVSACVTHAKHSDEVASRALRAVLGEPSTSQPSEDQQPEAKRKRKRGKQFARSGHSSAADTEDTTAPARMHAKRSKTSKQKRARHEAEPGHVDGVFADGELYLKDPETLRVYSSTRDAHGRLRQVCAKDPGGGKLRRVDEPGAKSVPPAATRDEDGSPPACEPARRRPRLPESLAFEADAEDHCETAPLAYKDVKPLLLRLCHALGKAPQELRIYDPYYCAGSVVTHLQELGFPSVHNRNEDFYAAIESGSVPHHDVLLTNPPYSADHMERLLAFCAKHDKPWMLLVPSYVHQKPYYQQSGAATGQCRPFYVVPKKRYNYWSPKGAGRGNPKVRKDGRTSPFVTLWHANCLQANGKVLRWWQANGHKQSPNVRIYKDASSIPDRLLDDTRPRRKRVTAP